MRLASTSKGLSAIVLISAAERLHSLAGPAARNVMPRTTVTPARSSATLGSRLTHQNNEHPLNRASCSATERRAIGKESRLGATPRNGRPDHGPHLGNQHIPNARRHCLHRATHRV